MHQKGIWYEMYVGNVTQNIQGAVHNVSNNDCEEVRTVLIESCVSADCSCEVYCTCLASSSLHAWALFHA